MHWFPERMIAALVMTAVAALIAGIVWLLGG